MAEGMGRNRLVIDLIKQAGVYSRSLTFFALLALALLVGVNLDRLTLRADEPPAGSNVPGAVNLQLQSNGELYFGKKRLPAELETENGRYLFRYQVIGTLINQPDPILDELKIAVRLPAAATDQSISHFFRNNGGATAATSQLIDPQTILYTARDISKDAKLTLEVELPQSFITRTLLFSIRQQLRDLPTPIWVGLSISLPVLTLLLLAVVALARARRTIIPREDTATVPSRLAPALLGILIKGRISNREIAATFFDLARRGHLIIRQDGRDDFKFSRRHGTDRLEPFEATLLDQVFGADDKSDTKEVSLTLANELFGQKVSQSFLQAYQRINQLGYFYTSPLKLHRRYQVAALVLFGIGVAGFFANLLFFADFRYLMLFWLGMMITSLLVVHFARSLPIRTMFGQKELGRWLAFRRFLVARAPIPYQNYTQDEYLKYLPYAIVLQIEPEWTRRFYDLPFSQPNWYLAARITTIDEFANRIFPMFGYLSQALAMSSAPSVR
jgi:hypothetical protein